MYFFYIYATQTINGTGRPEQPRDAGLHQTANRGFMKRHETHPGSGIRPLAGSILSLLLILLATAMLCSCGKKKTDGQQNFISVPADLNDSKYTIGVVSETNSCIEAKKAFPQAHFIEYEKIADAYPDLEKGTLDAIAFDRPVLEYAQRTGSSFVLMRDNYAEGHVAIAVAPDKPDYLQAVDKFLHDWYFSSGLYDRMYARWIKSSNPKMPSIKVPEESQYGKLVVGTANTKEPMNFTDSDGKPAGFDIELIRQLASIYEMSLEIRVMPYNELFTAVENSEIDLAVASMDRNDENAKGRNILFSDKYINSPSAILTRKDLYKPATNAEEEEKSIRELAGTYVAVLKNSKYASECKDLLPDTKTMLAEDTESACAMLISNKCDSILMEEPLARSCTAMYPELKIAAIVKRESYSFVSKDSRFPMSRIIHNLKESGELDDMIAKWCSADYEKQDFYKNIEQEDVLRTNGTLYYATPIGSSPLCFTGSDSVFRGLEIEIMRRAADEFGMDLQIIPARRDMLLSMVLSEQGDVVGGMLSPEEGNNENVLFSIPYYEGGAALVTRTPHDEYVLGITKLSQLAGKRVGVLAYTFAASELDKKLPQAIPYYANEEKDLFYLLGTGSIDAFLIDESHARMQLPTHPRFTRVGENVANIDYAFFFPAEKRELCRDFSNQIVSMKNNGTLKSVQKNWMSAPMGAGAVLPPAEKDAPNGVLRMGVLAGRDPFSFLRNGELTGYDLEIAQRAAAAMGKSVEFVKLNPGHFEEALLNGTVDFAAAEITGKYTSSGKLVYSEPHYNGGIVAIVPDKTNTQKVRMALIPRIKFFLKEQAYSLHRSIWKDNHMRQILGGFKITLLITASAVIFGTLLGIPLCMLRQSRRKWFSVPADIVCMLLYNIPILILLMGMYYVVLSRFGFRPLTAAIAVFILRFTAASCRLYMTTMEHIGGVQLDAARALCIRPSTFFRRIILPQAAVRLAKPFREEIIRLVELTTVVGYISVWDLTKVVDWIRVRTYESFYPIVFATLLYFLLALSLIAFISLLGRKLETSIRKHQVGAAANPE